MKLSTAIIKPFKLDDVREALADAGSQVMTVSETRGFGRIGDGKIFMTELEHVVRIRTGEVDESAI